MDREVQVSHYPDVRALMSELRAAWAPGTRPPTGAAA